MPKKILLTFDIEGIPGREDFINNYILKYFHKVLKLLDKYGFRGLFFINGNVVTDICRNHEINNLLSKNVIGFHSSSHSVKPMIFEYVDVPDYNDAMERTIIRENSSIDPYTGEINGIGGIQLLRESFPEKNIKSFKAPFDYFSPPHVEALRELGLTHVFSCDLYNKPFFFKGLTFYPKTYYMDGVFTKLIKLNDVNHYHKKHTNSISLFLPFLIERFKSEFIILGIHPSHFYYGIEKLKNIYRRQMYPFHLRKKRQLSIDIDFYLLDLFYKKLYRLQKMNLVDVEPDLFDSNMFLNPNEINIGKNYQYCISLTSNIYGYNPKYLLNHYRYFFDK
ncbi:MAG: hypothetical protein ACTSPV_02750 [Candidatus Hodarchaeales archaeon]